MNIFPNNTSKKNVVDSQKSYFPKTGAKVVKPYYSADNAPKVQPYDHFESPNKKKGPFAKVLKWLAIGTAGFMGVKLLTKTKLPANIAKAVSAFIKGFSNK